MDVYICTPNDGVLKSCQLTLKFLNSSVGPYEYRHPSCQERILGPAKPAEAFLAEWRPSSPDVALSIEPCL